MNNHHLRGIILKLESRLSDDDRKRLHFFIGNDVPRRIRDDPSLGGTLNLMESLFDQDKINEEDFTFLINAFDEIQCRDAVKLLREHMQRIHSSCLNQSVLSLASIMPSIIDQSIEDDEEDKYAVQFPSITQRTILNNSIEMIDMNDINGSSSSEIADNQSSRLNLTNGLSMRQKYLLPSALLVSIIGLGVLTGMIIIRSHQSTKELKMKDTSILREHTKNNKILKELNGLQLMVNQSTQQLIYERHQSFNEQRKQNETIQELIKKLKQSTHSSILNISLNAQWSQNGVTVAGGYGSGNATNQLDSPFGLSIDDKQTIIIADWGNDRIVEWKKGDKQGRIISSGYSETNLYYRIRYPTDVLIDKETDSIIICNSGRVLRWSRRSDGTEREILIDRISCYGLAMNDQKFLYVSDHSNSEIRRYQIGKQNGTVVAGGHERGSGLNQFNDGYYIFVDQDQTVYVSDNENHRVMKWNRCATEGVVVAGGQGMGNAPTQLSLPQGLFVDTSGTVYVADSGNHRVMRWFEGTQQGTVIVGGQGQGEGVKQLNTPWGLTFDRHGNLYVVDSHNNRVQRFSLEPIP